MAFAHASGRDLDKLGVGLQLRDRAGAAVAQARAQTADRDNNGTAPTRVLVTKLR